MTTSKGKLVQPETFNNDTELLVTAFYDLRKAFENQYSGKLRSHKYEQTREFTISLNYAIFQANQLDSKEVGFSQKTLELETKLQSLRTDWNHLKL